MQLVLVVDDDEQVCAMIKTALEAAGYEVYAARDGNQATRLMRELQPQVLITDLIMPEKEGLELIKEVRRNFPAVGIIAMTGGAKIEPEPYLKLASKLGADALLTKPFSFEELVSAVKQAGKARDADAESR